MKAQLEIVKQYLNLKAIEKDAASAACNLKPVFYAAMGTLGVIDQLAIDDALIYRRTTKTYSYSKSILAAEEKLKALKKAFEEKNEPAQISSTWAVKF